MRPAMRSFRAFPALAVALALLVSTAGAQPALWQQKLPADLKRFSMTAYGTLLVQLENELFALNPETGERAWSRPGVTASRVVGGTPFMVLTLASDAAVADIETGKDRWSFGSLGFTSMKGVLPLAAAGLLLVYGATPDSPHTLVALKLESGERVWTQSSLFADPALAPKAAKIEYKSLFLDGDTLVLDPSHDGLIRLDVKTGRLVWRIAEADLPGKGWPLEMFSVGRVLFGFWNFGDRVLGIGLDEGKMLWSRKEAFPVPVSQLGVTPDGGVILRGGYEMSNGGRKVSWHPFLARIDPVSGATRWMLQKEAFQARSAFILEDGRIVAAQKDAIVSFEAASGAPVNTIKMPEFEGGEDPAWVTREEDGALLVGSSQNLRRLDATGKLVYSVYLKAPGASFLSKLGTIGLAVGLSAVAGAAMQGLAPGMVPIYLPGPNSPLTARFKATSFARRYAYIFTEEAEGGADRFALVRLDRTTGKDTGRVRFSERAPSFTLDPATGIVVTAHDGTLTAHRFSPVPEVER